MKRLLKILSAPVRTAEFHYFFLLALVCNLFVLKYAQIGSSIAGIVCFAALEAYVQSALIAACRRSGARRWLVPAVMSLFVLLNNVLLLTDSFLLLNFSKIFNQDIADIIADTNTSESRQFFHSYITWTNALYMTAILGVVNGIALLLGRLLSRFGFTAIVMWLLTAGGICISADTAYTFIKYRNGGGSTQNSSLTRMAYCLYIVHQNARSIDSLAARLRDFDKAARSVPSDSLCIVMIIGESHSVFHSSVYGYDKDTMPELCRRRDAGELVCFSDAVTFDDHTITAMKSIFSTGRCNQDFYQRPLFPKVFRTAGFTSVLYDNQYTVGNGVSFLSSEDISSEISDIRNTRIRRFDGELADSIPISEGNTLIIFHMLGCHYTYSERYPQPGFSKFRSSDYDGTEYEKEIKAHYDNAVLYCDHVIDRLISRLSSKNAVVIYVSDHGEEVYEQGSMGHGFAAAASSMDYQMRVPMLVWGSPGFRAKHADKWDAICKAKDMPVATDDISHFLFDLADITTPAFDSTRSVISKDYDATHHRIMLNSIDYDRK